MKQKKKIKVRYLGNLHFRFGCARHLLWSFGQACSEKKFFFDVRV